MDIKLTDNATKWFEEKFPLNDGEAVRFFGKTYGKTEVHDGFSLGVQVDNPENHEDILSSTEYNELNYFTKREDELLCNDNDLKLDNNQELDQPKYHFVDTNKENYRFPIIFKRKKHYY